MPRRYNAQINRSLLLVAFLFSFLWLLAESGHLPVGLGIALGFTFAIAMAVYTTRLISQRITIVAETAGEMAEGDLEKTIVVHDQDQVGKLAQSLNQIAHRLRDTLSEVTEEKDRMHAVLDSMADGVIAVNAEGKVILVNPVAENVFGIREETSRGKTIVEVVRDFELDRLFQETLTSGHVVKKELRILIPDPRIFRLHLTPLRGKDGGIVVLFRDITKRRLLEQMRTEFVANASHELRTPLTSIQGFVETLQDGAIEDPPVAKKFLRIIDEEAKRLSRLVDDLLELAKAEQNRGSFERESTRVQEVLARVLNVLEPLIKEKKLDLRIDIPSDLNVDVDPNALYQILMNLVDNAVRFTEEGWISIHASQEPGGVWFEVEDSGIGIDQQHLPRVFERFYRVDKARSTELGGTGLGLAIVKHIVEGHGGKVGVSSMVGRGTTFEFLIPSQP
ncbi:MAG: ATP-binding protein [Clostridia bacterium]|nr:ATP-binding protein [Clostridia bacterium]MDQ7791438.1 ATP-binding protein [Clostridia bacterium]